MTSDASAALPLELALSGGGVRAMAFHAGVFRYLAEFDSLHRVRHVSTVSGGSLLLGLVFHRAGMAWPTSEQYLTAVLPAIRRDMTSHDLQRRALRRLLHPRAWPYLLSRANVVAQIIEACWHLHATLADLPDLPQWSINGTTAETGRRFRFKSNQCGDYQLGYADAKQFRLSHALAVSAAFPGGIGPLALKTAEYTWKKRPHWNAPEEEAQVVSLPFKRLHLYDGGVYDNLGLEPLFDVGQRRAKAEDHSILIVSDAGAPLQQGFSFGTLNPWRMKRIMDITMEQQRALRVRVFANALQIGQPGAYLQIGTSAIESLARARVSSPTTLAWLTSPQAQSVAATPTSLSRLSPEAFDQVERHGYETAKWNDLAYPYLSRLPVAGDAETSAAHVRVSGESKLGAK
jgi:NTE family protein